MLQLSKTRNDFSGHSYAYREPDDTSVDAEIDINNGKAIRVARRCRGLSQIDLADALGVVQSNISKWETGVEPVPIRIQNRLIDLLSNRTGYLDPFLKHLVRNDPTVTIFLPQTRDGVPDSKILKVSDLPLRTFSMLRGEVDGKSVSQVFRPEMIHNIHSKVEPGDNLMLDIERDVIPKIMPRGVTAQRLRSTHMYVQFEGYPKLIVAHSSFVGRATAEPPVVYDRMTAQDLDSA